MPSMYLNTFEHVASQICHLDLDLDYALGASIQGCDNIGNRFKVSLCTFSIFGGSLHT